MISINTQQIAEITGGEVFGLGETTITGIATPENAQAGDLTFADTAEYLAAAEQSAASAILVGLAVSQTSSGKILIRVKNPRMAVAMVLPFFYPPDVYEPGIHASATIAASAQIDSTAHIGPNCVIGERVQVGERTVLMGGNHLAADCRLGTDARLYPNVIVYARTIIGDRVMIHAGSVIGSDGYGYIFDVDRHRKVLQVGNVVIGSDVEIGANCAIDRGALGSTVIGKGTKIDNLVHVAHNVVMGDHCLVMGQVGFAGSTRLGNYSVIASQSGIAGHLKLGNRSTVGAKSGVMRDIPDGGTVLGIPAAPHGQAKRQWVAVQQMPDVIRRMREMEKQLMELTAARAAG